MKWKNGTILYSMFSQWKLLVVAQSAEYVDYVCVMVFNATFQQYFSYIVAASFIGGGNRSTRHKALTNLNTKCCIMYMGGIRIHNVSGDRHRLHR
jgi:hypothetical protein